MRQTLPLPLPIVFLVAASFFAVSSPVGAETIRQLRVELDSAGPAGFAVENLAGRMQIRAGSGDRTVVSATIHAESELLAGQFRLETVTGPDGAPTVRVRYPAGESRIRYRPARSSSDEGFLQGLFSGSFDGSHRYDGRRFRVSGSHGTLLYADVEVEIPRRNVSAAFRNAVGVLTAEGLSGRLAFDVDSADVRLETIKGEIRVKGSSGDVLAEGIEGRFTSDFSSGDVVLNGFSGDSVDFRSSSGDVRADRIDAARLTLETGSGDFRLSGADVADLSARTGSGDIQMEARGRRLARFQARTGSGDVELRLPASASFDARADLSSGDMHVGFSDGFATLKNGDLIAYRRGEGGARIEVKTGSGNLVIEPD